MRYRNTKTGAIVDSSFKITGKYWVEYNAEQKPVKEEYVEEEINLEDMVKADLIKLAQEHNVDINEKDTKAVMIETITKAFN